MSKFFQNKIERDFEQFVRGVGKLQPTEFCGLAKIMGIGTLRQLEDIGMRADDLKEKSSEEIKEIADKLTIPTDEILENMMDKFLDMSAQQRKTILSILKDVKRGK